MTDPRRCQTCKCVLSQYNYGIKCHPCQRKEAEAQEDEALAKLAAAQADGQVWCDECGCMRMPRSNGGCPSCKAVLV